MHDADSADPLLPPELERVIFELAVWQNPETIFALVLVAKRVCTWIEPELYHVVVFGKPRSLLMLESKPSQFLGQHVHHLAIPANVLHVDVVRILSTCTGVHDLAIWNNISTRPDLLPLLRKLTNLQCLSANLFALFGGRDDFTLDQFRIPSPRGATGLWPVFKLLPRVTHLSVTDTYSPEVINAALGTCPVLQLLVAVWGRDPAMSPPPDESKISTDPRFCIVLCSLFEFDWELGARGGRDVWRRAEEAVANNPRERQKGSDVRE
ncbi:hypothetical protein B0H16DRAFT_1885583 [Mycena metata]|uniref:Uncharacterized protein n=1 Tax=Mycena metata TaxID=1033252 RepID=A0AAD7J5H5_9AGAR|nr:hypothetical protein B0H16DRAFT_1885583 [Mycena metata]